MFCNDSKELKDALEEEYEKKGENKMIRFMDELIYGKKINCMNMRGRFETFVIYLHQTTPDILVANSLQYLEESIVFNLNVARLVPIPLEDEETLRINSEKSNNVHHLGLLLKEDEE